ncbi:major facilitator superfamily transporter sugar protein [Neofusicoccum parvum]|uniref:Major facilitator superfamily transporter sugar protein n=1 Tax=Neofusicoccum parvum TaxID=310453 RepID=A0ACB5SDG4_9PEZI|nr:major facilitator superfamily transporter sugar protein [Neofusicoccum parvum]
MTGSADHEPGVASEDTTMDWNVDDSDVNTEFTQERFEAMTNFEFPDTDGAGTFSPDFFNTTDLESMAGALATAESSTPDSMSLAQPEMDTATPDPNVNISSPAAPSALLTPAPPTYSHGNMPSDCTPSATPEAVDDGVDLMLRRCLACKKQKRRCTGGIPCDLCNHRGKTADECEEDVNYKRRKKADLRKTPAPEKIKKTPKANKNDKEGPASGSQKAESSGGAGEAAAARLRTLAPAPAPATFMSAAPAAQLTDNNTSAPTTPIVSAMSADAQPATESDSAPVMASPDSPTPPHAPAGGSGSGSGSGSCLTAALPSTASDKSSMAPGDTTVAPTPTTAGTSASAEPAAQNSASAAGNDKQPSNDRSTTPEGTPQPPSMLPLQSPAPSSASADDTQKPAPKKRAATPKKAPGEKKATATPKEKKTPTPRKRPTKADQPKGTSVAPIKGSGLRNEIFPSETISPSNSAHETPPTSSSSQQQHARALSDGPPSTPHPDADYIDVSNLLNPAAFAAHARDPAGAFARSPHAASPAALTSFSRFIEASRQALASNPTLMPADTRAQLSASASPTLAAILADTNDNKTAAPQPQHSPRPAPAALPPANQAIALPARIPSTSIVAAKRSAATAPAGPAPCSSATQAVAAASARPADPTGR